MRRARLPRLDQRAFTLVELLVAIAVIGVLSTTATVALSNVRQTSRLTAARADVTEFQKAVQMMYLDTGKYPGGCTNAASASYEALLENPQAGLASKPRVATQGTNCRWTQEDLDNWLGPYAKKTSDPWGHPYMYDPDYYAYQNCPTQDDLPESEVIVSYGPNGVGMNAYDCDDIFAEVE